MSPRHRWCGKGGGAGPATHGTTGGRFKRVERPEDLVPDDLWEAIKPLLPPHPAHPRGGRPFIPDRSVLAGILFVLVTGTQWAYLPVEMGCGSGPTCRDRLRRWTKAGVWDALRRSLSQRLNVAERVDWERAARDSGPASPKGLADRRPDPPHPGFGDEGRRGTTSGAVPGDRGPDHGLAPRPSAGMAAASHGDAPPKARNARQPRNPASAAS